MSQSLGYSLGSVGAIERGASTSVAPGKKARGRSYRDPKANLPPTHLLFSQTRPLGLQIPPKVRVPSQLLQASVPKQHLKGVYMCEGVFRGLIQL